MKKLLIITRDGYAAKKFAEDNNLTEMQWKRVKKFEDINGVEPNGYVIIRPTPPGYLEIIEYLESEEFENKTPKYNKCV